MTQRCKIILDSQLLAADADNRARGRSGKSKTSMELLAMVSYALGDGGDLHIYAIGIRLLYSVHGF